MKTVAIVEDNADNRLLLRAILEGRYRLQEYASGPAALEGMAARPPDVILLDISLPEMDGTEVLDRLQGSPALRAVPVVALTAHAMAGDREKFLAAGFDCYVAKPILDERELLAAIEELLGREERRS